MHARLLPHHQAQVCHTHTLHNGLLLERWFIIGGRAWASMHCWSNVLSWHTNHG